MLKSQLEPLLLGSVQLLSSFCLEHICFNLLFHQLVKTLLFGSYLEDDLTFSMFVLNVNLK